MNDLHVREIHSINATSLVDFFLHITEKDFNNYILLSISHHSVSVLIYQL